MGKVYIIIISCLILWKNAGSQYTIIGDFIEDLLRKLEADAQNQLLKNTDAIDLKDRYDFIVVGSGSSGSVMASRLSEETSRNVLLLEAGTRPAEITRVPFLTEVLQKCVYDWAYQTEPETGACQAMREKKCAQPRGKALGGSTVINNMIYSRPTPLDHEEWVNLTGDSSWSYDNCFPYYLKSEDCQLGGLCSNGYHHTGGPHTVSWPYFSKATDIFIEGGKQLGEPEVDYNTRENIGFSKVVASLDHGKRVTSATAFLDPISASRPNLKIVTSATVTKILINNNTATGVEFTHLGLKYVVNATKEVILSAGVFNSAQLLMLSGIGPRDHLESLNIEVKKDLPVGETMYDHVQFLGFLVKLNETVSPITGLINPLQYVDYLIRGEGVLSSLIGAECVAFINTLNASATDSDLEYLMVSVGDVQADGGLTTIPIQHLDPKFYFEYFSPIAFQSYIAILPTLILPKSIGKVKLSSNNPFDAPLIYGNHLTDAADEDVKTLVRGVRFLQELVKTEAFQKYGAEVYSKPVPGCENMQYDSEDYWICAMRKLCFSIHHQTSTCKMGAADDATAVIDPEARVRGINGLRVVDTSSIPKPLRSHLNAPAMMIAEKISDIIKKAYPA